MAILFITEYEDLGRDAMGDVVPAAKVPAQTTSKADFTSAAAQSAAFGVTTRFVCQR